MNEIRISQQFVCIFLILLLAACGAPTAEPTHVPSEATYTPVPPTATPTLTPTVMPTNTAMPTSTPTATDTMSASNPYLDEVNLNLQAYQNALANASDYVQTPTTDFNVLLNDNWKQNAEAALGQLDDVANQLENIDNAPPEQKQLYMYLKSIASETHELVDNYGNGINQLDLDAINSAINNLSNITSYMNSAKAELDKYANP